MASKQTITPVPFLPFVSIDQIMAFDPERPETFTASPAVNAVCRAIAAIGLKQEKDIAAYLAVSARSLSGAIAIATGYNFRQLHTILLVKKVLRTQKEHPGLKGDPLARSAGLPSRTSLFTLMHSNDYRRYAELPTSTPPEMPFKEPERPKLSREQRFLSRNHSKHH